MAHKIDLLCTLQCIGRTRVDLHQRVPEVSRFAEILVISPTLGVRALPKVASVSVVDQCSAAELPTLLQELSPHSIQLFAGVNTSAIRELLDAVSDSPGLEAARPILLLASSSQRDRTSACLLWAKSGHSAQL